MSNWPEHKTWLWAARVIVLSAVLAPLFGVGEMRVAVAFVMAIIMYATSAILRALTPPQAG